jgi:hypothetical protein
MNRRQKTPQHRTQAPAYRQAFERLDEALEQNTQSDYSEKLELLGLHLFGDLWKARKPGGPDVLPK